jgi:hypothetical protein
MIGGVTLPAALLFDVDFTAAAWCTTAAGAPPLAVDPRIAAIQSLERLPAPLARLPREEGGSAGRPAESSPGQHVQVDVKDSLARVGIAVEDRSIA